MRLLCRMGNDQSPTARSLALSPPQLFLFRQVNRSVFFRSRLTSLMRLRPCQGGRPSRPICWSNRYRLRRSHVTACSILVRSSRLQPVASKRPHHAGEEHRIPMTKYTHRLLRNTFSPDGAFLVNQVGPVPPCPSTKPAQGTCRRVLKSDRMILAGKPRRAANSSKVISGYRPNNRTKRETRALYAMVPPFKRGDALGSRCSHHLSL